MWIFARVSQFLISFFSFSGLIIINQLILHYIRNTTPKMERFPFNQHENLKHARKIKFDIWRCFWLQVEKSARCNYLEREEIKTKKLDLIWNENNLDWMILSWKESLFWMVRSNEAKISDFSSMWTIFSQFSFLIWKKNCWYSSMNSDPIMILNQKEMNSRWASFMHPTKRTSCLIRSFRWNTHQTKKK